MWWSMVATTRCLLVQSTLYRSLRRCYVTSYEGEIKTSLKIPQNVYATKRPHYRRRWPLLLA